jgi:membrane glycosyltransferase
LFLGTIVVVLLPKTLGILLALAHPLPDAPRLGVIRCLAGGLVETLFSILIAPILMLTQTTAVIEILRGKDSGWSAQRRDGDAPDLTHLLRFHLWHELIGAALAVVCALASIYVFAWMGPIVLGLLLSVGISHVTSRPAPAWMAKALATAEDLNPPGIVAAAGEAYPRWAARVAEHRRANIDV